MADKQFVVGSGESKCFVDIFGDGPQLLIEAGAQVILFCWSDLFGPIPECKNGDVRDLNHRHPFWHAVSLWNLQGRRIADDGSCLWHEPKKPVLRHLGGRNYEVIEDGEEGYDW